MGKPNKQISKSDFHLQILKNLMIEFNKEYKTIKKLHEIQLKKSGVRLKFEDELTVGTIGKSCKE